MLRHCKKSFSKHPGSPKLRMVSWNLNTLAIVGGRFPNPYEKYAQVNFGSFPQGLSSNLLILGINSSHLQYRNSLPTGSMYGIFTYIWLIFMVNVGEYAIHGSYGLLGINPYFIGLKPPPSLALRRSPLGSSSEVR